MNLTGVAIEPLVDGTEGSVNGAPEDVAALQRSGPVSVTRRGVEWNIPLPNRQIHVIELHEGVSAAAAMRMRPSEPARALTRRARLRRWLLS